MYVSGVESKLPNGVMLPVEYTEYGAQVLRSIGFEIFTDALRHIPFCLTLQRHCSSILLYYAVIHLLFYCFYPHLCCSPEYEPRYSRREKPLSARFRIGQVCRAGPLPHRASHLLFSSRTATPRSECLTLGLFLLCILRTS